MITMNNFNYTITDTLLHLLEEYLSEQFVKTLNKLSVIEKTEEFNQTVHVAGELRKSIVANLEFVAAESSDQMSSAIKSEQVPLVQQMQSALSALQVLVLDHVPELAPAIGDQELRRVAVVATQLHKELAAVVTIAEITVPQANIETEFEVLKDLITDGKSTITAGQEEKPLSCDDTIKCLKEVAYLKEHATETAVEPVVSLAGDSEKLIVVESESQLKDEVTETAAVISDQVASLDNADNVAIVEMREKLNEIISAKCAALSTVETMTLDSEVSIPAETFVATEEQVAIRETKDDVVQNIITKLENDVNDSARTADEVKALTPSTGNCILN